jgi:hypothetical protein
MIAGQKHRFIIYFDINICHAGLLINKYTLLE